jgi:hypothetical protein
MMLRLERRKVATTACAVVKLCGFGDHDFDLGVAV